MTNDLAYFDSCGQCRPQVLFYRREFVSEAPTRCLSIRILYSVW